MDDQFEAAKRLLAQYCVEKGLASSTREVLSSDKLPLQFIAKRSGLDEAELHSDCAKHCMMEFVELHKVMDRLNSAELLGELKARFLWERRCCPLYEDGDFVVVGLANPFDYDAIKTISFVLSKNVRPVVVEDSRLQKHLATTFPEIHNLFGVLQEAGEELFQDEDLQALGADASPVVKLVNKLLADAIAAGASDIHIEPGEHQMEVRFRVDGIMQKELELPANVQRFIISRLKLLSGLDIAEHRRPQDGRLRVKDKGQLVDMRVSCIPSSFGEKLVLRLLVADLSALSFKRLEMQENTESRLKELLGQKGKMVLVTGPTGSGKTTSLYTFLNFLHDGTSNIQTVEDPIEFRIPGITQVQTNEAAGVNFATALRSILRQDPDVILVGEIRDEETAKIAIQAAQTGHLVLSTLHTNDAPSGVHRLMNLGVEPYQIANSVGAIIAQRLVRKVCVSCSRLGKETDFEGQREQLDAAGLEPTKLVVADGCTKCGFSGFKGRTAIYSMLEIDEPTVEDIITHGGESRLGQVGLEKVRNRETMFSEIAPFLIGRPAKSVSVPASKPKVTEPSSNRQSVLLIEDDDDVAFMLGALLERDRYIVERAENGEVGLEKLLSNPPDVVICDLMMPVMSGRDFLVRAKANKQVRDIPVIFLTANDTSEKEVELLDLGASDFVSKGRATEVLLSRIRRTLN